jgi:apurinic endonuclease APN1
MNIGIHLNNYSGKYESKNILELIEKTKTIGGNVLQIFLGNKILTTLREKYVLKNDEINEIKKLLKDYKIKMFVHAILSLNYCINPYSGRNKWATDNLIYDMNLCKKLNGVGCVLHMGSYKTKKIDISENECIKNFINTLILILDETKKVPIILETPVNRDNIVGGSLESMSKIYNLIPEKYRKRVKICVDTQHIFVSGYDIRTEYGVNDYFDKFNNLIGLKNLVLIHLNDSEKIFNSKIDRHYPIRKGYIFKNSGIEGLKSIINVGIKNKISMVLETNPVNFKKEIITIKRLYDKKNGGLSKINKNKTGKTDKKLIILKIFKELLEYYESLGKSGNLQTRYRIESYKKAIKSLESFNNIICSANDVKDLESIGKGFYEKINEIVKSGSLKIYENIAKNNKKVIEIKSIKLFQNIWGIGVEFARSIVKKKIYTISSLKKAIKNNKIKLNDQQLIGLKYYNELKLKIPREEIKLFTKYFKKILNNKSNDFDIYNAGSYRAKVKECGDIDLIISYNKDKITLDKVNEIIYELLNKEHIIIDILSNGYKKSIYIINNPISKKIRKMDVAFVESENISWYLLYFGSSREFSKKIRLIVSKMGYKLNEKGLFYKNTGKKINFNPKDEKDIFNFLKIDYVKPENRR